MLARLHFVIHIEPGTTVEYDVSDIERQLAGAVRAWSDDLREALIETHGEDEGLNLFRRYRGPFRPGTGPTSLPVSAWPTSASSTASTPTATCARTCTGPSKHLEGSCG